MAPTDEEQRQAARRIAALMAARAETANTDPNAGLMGFLAMLLGVPIPSPAQAPPGRSAPPSSPVTAAPLSSPAPARGMVAGDPSSSVPRAGSNVGQPGADPTRVRAVTPASLPLSSATAFAPTAGAIAPASVSPTLAVASSPLMPSFLDANAADPLSAPPLRDLITTLSSASGLARGVLLSEILGPPRAFTAY